MGQATSPSLYDFACGDPVNFFDPTGRCPNDPNKFNNGLFRPTEVNVIGGLPDPGPGGLNPADPNAGGILQKIANWLVTPIDLGSTGNQIANQLNPATILSNIGYVTDQVTQLVGRVADEILPGSGQGAQNVFILATVVGTDGLAEGDEASAIWSATKDLSPEENAAAHAAKHAADFPELSSDADYVQAAQQFVTDPPPGALTKVRPNGDTLIYDPSTNTFAVRDPSGAPRTMFRPSDGANYWSRQ